MDTIETLYAERLREDSSAKGDGEKHPDFMTKWRRALAHVANYCIENRMKTPLGKPMDTFNKIGGELLRLAKEAMVAPPSAAKPSSTPRSSVSARDRTAKDDEEALDIGEPRTISAAEEWWRVRCLLEFVEIFEKLMYHVNNGTMFPICNVSVLSRQFFTTNVASCQEWLSRTYPFAMIVAYHNGYYAQVIRFGSSALVDLEKKQLKCESALAEGSSPAYLHLPLAKLARKTGNPLLAGIHLHKASSSPVLINNSPILNSLRVAVQGTKMMWEIASPEQRARSFVTVFATLQGGYEMFCHSYQLQAVVNMEVPPPFEAMNGFVNGFSPLGVPFGVPPPNVGVLSPSSSAALGEEMSRTCLRLANWLADAPQLVTAIPPECRQSRLWMRLDTAGRDMMGCDMVGSLLAIATELSPTLGKAHRRLGDWAFYSAESAASEKDKPLFDKNYRMLLGENVPQSTLDGLWKALNTANSVAQLRESVAAALPNDTLLLESLLMSDSHYSNLWAQIRQRRSVFYGLAVTSYFAYISQLGGKATVSHKGTIGSVSATLRILGLLTKHADFLHDVIDQGLRATNEHLWKDILPQLFARLSHPVKEVREALLGLLSRLCYSAPHAVVFQAVAGASSSMLVAGDDDVIDASEKDDDDNSNKERCLMFEGCRVLVAVLEENYPKLVKDVREFVNELQRINLLNEERWTFVLANLDHEMEKRLEQIRAESEKTVNAAHLDDKTRLEIIAEKSRLITSSVYRILDDLYERTCLREPTTQNERAFVQVYGEKLQSVFEQSRANRKSPEKSWAPFRHMLGILLQKNSRRGGHALQMSEISPILSEAQIKHSMEKKSGVPATTAALDIDRPTDLFQKKMRGVFIEHNVEAAVIADRSKWPHNLLKEVFNTLLKETPKDLISRELWMRAGSCDTWWRVVCRYARSTAVMSMIGAILGLGDRHLDNVLVNLDRGDIVHIDYNICFDKGRHLRVPETVPFRLTQNILHALGPTQVEGVFRESCSNVLSTLREGREVLLTVLDAFVYDPLVDWTVSDHLTASSAAVGVAVTLAVYGTDSRAVEAKPVAREMFSVRIRENTALWTKNFNELQSALASVTDVLQRENVPPEKNVWNNREHLGQERVEAGRRLKASIARHHHIMKDFRPLLRALATERVEAGRRLKASIARHHHIMKDFRPLLRALATCDERFGAYLKTYRERFSEPLVKAHQLLDAESLDLNACLRYFAVVQNNICDIYLGLLSLNESTQTAHLQSPSALSPNSTKSDTPELPPGFEDTRPHHQQQQEQNAHANSVVRRVRARLEGRIEAADHQKIITPNEQVCGYPDKSSDKRQSAVADVRRMDSLGVTSRVEKGICVMNILVA
ncbi:HEAT repeat protein, partial [Oesophagostomum dentatum]